MSDERFFDMSRTHKCVVKQQALETGISTSTQVRAQCGQVRSHFEVTLMFLIDSCKVLIVALALGIYCHKVVNKMPKYEARFVVALLDVIFEFIEAVTVAFQFLAVRTEENEKKREQQQLI